MDVRTVLRLGACAVAAVLSAGCLGTGTTGGGMGLLPASGGTPKKDKSGPPVPDNTVVRGTQPPADGSGVPTGPSGVVPASAQASPMPPLPAVPPVPSVQPAPVPPTPVLPAPSVAPGAGAPPATMPGASGVPGTVVGGAMPLSPHQRVAPTVDGMRLGLQPGENPLDRVIELATALESARLENRTLVGRMREVEGLGLGREQALAEALREVEAASAEVSKARTDLQTLRKELAALKERLETVEREDVETLRLVIAALERLLQPPPPAPPVPAPVLRPAGGRVP